MRNTNFSAVARGILLGLLLLQCGDGLYAKPLVAGSEDDGLDDVPVSREVGPAISTTFGMYRPYVLPAFKVTVGLAEPAIGAGFDNVAVSGSQFRWNNYFTASERAILRDNGFVVRPEAVGSFAQAYAAELSPEPMGSFVTVDAILHGLNVTISEARRDMERNYAGPALEGRLGELSDALAARAEAERNPTIAASMRTVLAYVQTAEALLNPAASIAPAVRDQVTAEVAKITAGRGLLPSTLFPRRTINYGLFAPSGYYTLDRQLAGYYRARVWLSQVGLAEHVTGAVVDPDGLRNVSLLARMIEGLPSGSVFGQTLRNINEPAAFFAGRASGLASWDILSEALRAYYGRVVERGPDFLADDEMLRGFWKFLGQELSAAGVPVAGPQFFQLIDPLDGQQHQVAQQVWADARSARGTYGLAVLAAAGSPRALELMGSRSAMAAADARRAAYPIAPAAMLQDLDGAVLHTLRPLLVAQRGEGYPHFTRSDAWRTREVASAAGAWADFQHDVATMPMESTVKAGRVGVAGGRVLDGYVEPAPEAWARLASLAAYIRSGLLEGRGDRLIGRAVEVKLRDIENVSAGMMQIAAAELGGKELTDAQRTLLRSMRDRIAAYETYADKTLQGDGYVIAAGSAEIADGVRVGTGHPMIVYAIVPRNDAEGGLMLTRGAVYSYYETDASAEQFRASLLRVGSGLAPEARLTEGYVSGDRSFAVDAAKLIGVSAAVPATAVAYTPGKAERLAELYRADLRLENSVIGRRSDELWFTVMAPHLEGDALFASIVTKGGDVLRRVDIGRVKDGERLDVLRVGTLAAGEYVIRVEDGAGTVLAAAPFRKLR